VVGEAHKGQGRLISRRAKEKENPQSERVRGGHREESSGKIDVLLRGQSSRLFWQKVSPSSGGKKRK